MKCKERKKKMKKILIAAILTLMLAVNCSAAGGEITVGHTDAKVGETAVLVVDIVNNPGFCYLRVRPEYDKNALELVSATAGDVYADTVDFALNVSVENGSDMHGDGSILKLGFKVKDGTAPGRYTVDLKFIECYNYDENDVAVSITGGYIDVTDESGKSLDTADNGDNTKETPSVTSNDPESGETERQVAVGTEASGRDGGKTADSRIIITAVICAAAAAAAVVAVVIVKKRKK